MKNKTILILTGFTAVALSATMAAAAYAQSEGVEQQSGMGASASIGARGSGPMMGMKGMQLGVFGKVTAINGTTITVSSEHPTSTVYTVDASNATVKKDDATSTVSSIIIGDTVMIQGTINGTSVTAKTIFDGVGMMNGTSTNRGGKGGDENASGTLGRFGGNPPHIASGTRDLFQGGVRGTVSLISGSSLTVTNQSGTAYSVDASAAVITKNRATTTLANVVVGDNIVVDGKVSSTIVTAVRIMDIGTSTFAFSSSTRPNDHGDNNSSTNSSTNPEGHAGIFGSVGTSIGGFFGKIFGMFHF